MEILAQPNTPLSPKGTGKVQLGMNIIMQTNRTFKVNCMFASVSECELVQNIFHLTCSVGIILEQKAG